MIEEMRMKNVYKIELRSSTNLSYDILCKWLREKNVPMQQVRGKTDTYWVNKYVQIETGHDCFYIGANGDIRSWETASWIFQNVVVRAYPFANMRHVKTDINNEYCDEGLSGTKVLHANKILQRIKKQRINKNG